MERFCDRCGSLVSGDVENCPLCGEKMGRMPVISSKLDVDTDNVFFGGSSDIPDETDFTSSDGSPEITAPFENSPYIRSQPIHSPQQSYTPLYTPADKKCGVNGNVKPMSMASWFGTLFLGTCLGMVSYIILLVWAFDAKTEEPVKSFARAMLLFLPLFHLCGIIGIFVLFIMV